MRLNNASEFFKIWKAYTLQKRTNKINKNLSKFNYSKKTLKSIWNAWKKMTSLEVIFCNKHLSFRNFIRGYLGTFIKSIRKGWFLKDSKDSSTISCQKKSKIKEEAK